MRKLLFIFALSLCSLAAWAYDISAVAPSGQTLHYTLTSDSTVEVAKNDNLTGSLTIPNTVVNGSDTYSVTGIGDSAFYHCTGLTSVTIPNTVTSIGDYVFYECSILTNVTIPNSVTNLGEWIFGYCSSLTDVTISNSVANIGNYVFYGCSGLTSVTIPNSVTSMGDYVFFGCISLTSLTISDFVTSIGTQTFCLCKSLTSLTIPNSVTSIGESAFYKCSGLTVVTIGSGVTSIDKYAFYGCERIDTIICNAVEPPTVVDINAFEGVRKDLPLIVPIESVSQYQSAYGWQDFYNIIGAPLGIEDLDNESKVFVANGAVAVSGAEGQTLRIYDVQGRLIVSEKAVDNKLYAVPTTGVYMVQVGNRRAQKVMVVR